MGDEAFRDVVPAARETTSSPGGSYSVDRCTALLGGVPAREGIPCRECPKNPEAVHTSLVTEVNRCAGKRVWGLS